MPKQVSTKINKKYLSEGIALTPIIYFGKKEYKLILPIYQNNKSIKDLLIKSESFQTINLLQDLWMKGIIYEAEKRQLYIPYISLYDIDNEVRDKLFLPSIDNVSLKISSHGAVGQPNFRLYYSIIHPVYGKINLEAAKRFSNVIVLPNGSFILPKEIYALVEEIDGYEVNNDFNIQAKFLAKIKKRAKTVNAELDSYIENEQYFFPEVLDININKKNNMEIELSPYFKDIDDEQVYSKLKDIEELSERILLADENKRKRIFIEPEVISDFKQIKSRKKISGTEIPRFLENPYAFLPDSISIEDFGDRVKELGIVVYKAQPFIRAKSSSKSGWFDYDIGIELKPEGMDDAESQRISDNEFEQLVKEAKNSDEEYVYYNDNWIKVDYSSAEEYLKESKRIKKEFPSKQFDITKLPYILKIFENISSLEYNATLLEERKKLTDEGILEYQKPRLLRDEIILKDFQKEGFKWIRMLDYQKLGGILADDMGLGKTVQVIAYMAFLKEKSMLKPSLIVVPRSLIKNWRKEIDKFTKGLGRIYEYIGSKRIKDKHFIQENDVVLTTYETLVRDQLVLGQINWILVACDEAQKIKNASTYAAGVAKALKAKLRLAITGTPVENGLNELWCISDFVQPGLLGSYKEFRKKYELPIQKADIPEKEIDNLKVELKNLISPIYLRRTKEEKLQGLPKKIEKKLSIKMAEKQEMKYSEIIRQYRNKEIKFFSALSSLMQLCSHIALIDNSYDIYNTKKLLQDSSKLSETINILKSIKNKGEKALIFTKFIKMQDILSNVIYKVFGIYPLRINGRVKHDRLKVIEAFENKKGFNAIILSPRAAGVGLNITEANHVIHYTRKWNPAVENQATDRAYRLGQKKDVIVYYPICITQNGMTVEERLDQLLDEKKKLIKDIVVPSARIKIEEKDFINYL